MNLREKIKIECIKKNITITNLSIELGYLHRQNMYHYIDKKNVKVLKKIEEVLSLPEGTLLQY